MSSNLIIANLVTLGLLVSSCSVSIQSETTATAAPIIITATLPSSPKPRPSETLLPPTSTPTVVPVQGTIATQLNVRAEPSTASEVLGIIAANQTIQIVGQDPGGNWWQILYEAGTDGKGWVTAQYVETAGKPEVPVIGGGEAGLNSGDSAVVIQQLNIRNGPGTSFDSLGILNSNDVVSLTGKNRDGTWLQIDFQGGPDEKGWISASFVKSDNLDVLPIVSDLGVVVGTGTPMNTPLPPTPTVVPAPPDFDSTDSPLKTILLEDAGTHAVLYNGDVSAPSGDTDDWFSVTPFGDHVLLGIQCFGSNSIRTEIVGTDITLMCNEAVRAIPVQDNASFLIHIQAISQSGQLQYTRYILTIKASQ